MMIHATCLQYSVVFEGEAFSQAVHGLGAVHLTEHSGTLADKTSSKVEGSYLGHECVFKGLINTTKFSLSIDPW